MNTLAPARMTVEEFLALPDDGIDRILIDGKLVEMGRTRRNQFHCEIVALVTFALLGWRATQPKPRGKVLTGDTGFCLPDGSETIVGIDVCYVSVDVLSQQTKDSSIIQGIPVLAVEVLSPSDTQKNIKLKLATYRRAKVSLVWFIDSDDRTVTVYRPGAKPKLVDDTMELSGEPELPGFSVMASQLFEK